jgi:hypothetical protein
MLHAGHRIEEMREAAATASERLLGLGGSRDAMPNLHASAPASQRFDDFATVPNFRRHRRNDDPASIGPAFRQSGIPLQNERNIHGARLPRVDEGSSRCAPSTAASPASRLAAMAESDLSMATGPVAVVGEMAVVP